MQPQSGLADGMGPGNMIMKKLRVIRLCGLLAGGGVLFGFGGCLGPNPLFFLSTSAANATVMRLVNTLLDSILTTG